MRMLCTLEPRYHCKYIELHCSGISITIIAITITATTTITIAITITITITITIALIHFTTSRCGQSLQLYNSKYLRAQISS